MFECGKLPLSCATGGKAILEWHNCKTDPLKEDGPKLSCGSEGNG